MFFAGRGTIAGRSLALGASTPWKRIKCKRGRGTRAASRLHELQRRHHDVGGAILVRTLQAQYDITGAIATEPAVGNCRAGDVAAQLFEFVALISAATHRSVQAEAVGIGAQGWCSGLASAGDGLQAQHLLPRAWPHRNAVGARGRLQGVSA